MRAIQEVRAVPIYFRCLHCEKLLAIGTAKGGTQIHCPMCARLITVPPRTEVKLPTTTVIPPDLAQAWWMDAPSVAPLKPETPPEQTSPPDAWWLTANAPPTPAETSVPTSPTPSAPPPLPEPIVSAPTTEPPPDLLSFEAPTKSPPLDTNSTNAPSRFLTPLYSWLVLMVIAASMLVATVLFVLLRG
jgi:phage FluMu protein Com